MIMPVTAIVNISPILIASVMPWLWPRSMTPEEIETFNSVWPEAKVTQGAFIGDDRVTLKGSYRDTGQRFATTVSLHSDEPAVYVAYDD